MAAKFCVTLVVAVSVLLTTSEVTSAAEDYAATASSLRDVLTKYFSENRNHAEGMAYHEAARDYIMKTFKDNGLEVTMPPFTTASEATGYNVVGIMAGTRNGTKDDRIIIVGAHFDTTPTTPGVDNNGSGLSAMLEALKLLKKSGCTFDNTIVFVAFDMKEEEVEGAACPTGMCGSKNYVSVVLPKLLEERGGKVKGALILDTMMNYDPSEGEQEEFLDGNESSQFKQFNDDLKANKNKGDFICSVGRIKSDAVLLTAFRNAWTGLSSPEYKIMDVKLDIEGVPTTKQISDYPRLMDSDHQSFWTNDPSYSAIYITDTDNKRGIMKECYHKACDNSTNLLTNDRLTFLAKSSYAVSKTLQTLAGCSETSMAIHIHSINAVIVSLVFGMASFLFV